MKEALTELLNHLKGLNYTQVHEAHAIRFKVASTVKDQLLSKRINNLKFNSWFLDPDEKRKTHFDQARSILVSIIENQLEILKMTDDQR